jgi:hypothetical protein
MCLRKISRRHTAKRITRRTKKRGEKTLRHVLLYSEQKTRKKPNVVPVLTGTLSLPKRKKDWEQNVDSKEDLRGAQNGTMKP